MKAKFGAIVVAGSGKLGGHVASRNRAGAYFRTKVTPVNPSTTYQQQARNILTGLSQSWRALTQDQILAWNAGVDGFATTDIFGDLRNPTGKNLYVRLGANLISVGSPPLSDIPSLQDVGFVTANSQSISLISPSWDLDAQFTAVGSDMQLWATPSVSAGKNFVKSLYRQIGSIAGGTASPFDIRPLYEARFGAPAIGEKVFVMLVAVNSVSGQKGVGSSTSTIVVP